MAQRTQGRVLFGILLALIGVASLTVGLVRAPFLPAQLGIVPGWTAATLGGFLLGLTGVMLSIFSMPRHEPPAPAVPAHVAFAQKRAPAPTEIVPVRAPAPAPRPAPRETPGTDTSLTGIETEIRELTRRINKAGVMLATGQLSDQGYAQYVAELKQRRGNLEASRVRAELRRKL